MLCMSVVHVEMICGICMCFTSEHIGVGCVPGNVLCRYSVSSRDLFAVSGIKNFCVPRQCLFLCVYFGWDAIY